MRIKTLRMLAAVVAVIGLAASATRTIANEPINPAIWTGGGADDNWSTLGNWLDATAPSGKVVVFNNTDAVATSNTVNNIVEADYTVASLVYTNLGAAKFHTTRIDAGRTLTVNGAGGLRVGVQRTNSVTSVAITGNVLTVSHPAANFDVYMEAAATADNNHRATLDLRGMASLSATVSNMNIGGSTGALNMARGTLFLPPAASITANALRVAELTGWADGFNESFLYLGQNTTLNVDEINIGRRHVADGRLYFQPGLSNPGLTIRNRAGTGRVGFLRIGMVDHGSDRGCSGIVDLSGGTVDALLDTVYVGYGSRNGGTGRGLLTFDAGAMDITTLYLGYEDTGTRNSKTSHGTNTVGGTATLTVGTLIMAHSLNTGTGTDLRATLNLNGGTLAANAIQKGSGTNSTRTLNFNGGTIRNKAGGALTISGLSVFAVTGVTNALHADNGATLTVSSDITGAGGLAKRGAGTLALSGTNSFGGGTAVEAGKLVAQGAGAVPVSGALTLAAGTTLGLADGTARTTTVGSLSLADGVTLELDWNGANQDQVLSTAAATASGTVYLSLANTSPSGGGGTLISSPNGGLSGATYVLINNTDFTATITVTDTAVSIGPQMPLTPLTAAYWMGNRITGGSVPGHDNSMTRTTGETSNWSTAQGSYGPTPLVPGSGADVVFSAVGASQQGNIVLGADLRLRSLTFNDATPVTIASGNTLTLLSTNAGASSALSANENATVNAPLAVTTNQTWTVAAGKTLTVGGPVGGTNGLTQAGGGTIALGATNTYGGTWALTKGTLRLAGGSLPSAALVITGTNATALAVDGNASVKSLEYRHLSETGATHTVTIAAGKTLTVSGGAFMVGVGDMNTANHSTTVTVHGAGALVFDSPAQDFLVGRFHGQFTGSENSLLDMSGLAEARITADELRVGWDTSTGPYYRGILNLAASNAITVNTIYAGSWAGSGTIRLGVSNSIRADNIHMAYAQDNPSPGIIQFNSGLTNPFVTVRNKAGSGRANLYMSYPTSGEASGSHMDFSLGTADALFGTVIIGRPRGNASGYMVSSGSLTLGTGSTVDITTATLGLTSSSSSGANYPGIGTINVNGGTLIVDDLRLGDQLHNVGVPRGYVNITNNGTVKATTIWKGPGTGVNAAYPPVRQINFSSGTLTHRLGTDLTVSSDISLRLIGSSDKTLFADTGRTVTLNGVVTNVSGNSGVVKTGGGTLLLEGVNAYTGLTTVAAGRFGGGGSLPGSLTFTDGTVFAARTNGAMAVAGTLTIGAGCTVEVSGELSGGDSYVLATYGSRIGTFSSVNQPSPWVVTYTSNAVILTRPKGTLIQLR